MAENLAEKPALEVSPGSSPGIVREATVLDFDPNQERARIYLDGLPGVQEIHARLALPYRIRLEGGDRVLVTGEDCRTLYIIGVISTKSPAGLQAQNGARAVLEDDGNNRVFRIFADDGELVVEYHPEKRTTKIRTTPGNLELEVPEGDLEFKSSRNMAFAAATINLAARESFTATAGAETGNRTSSFSLGKHHSRLNSPDLKITTGRTRLLADEFRFVTGRIFGSLARAVIDAEKLETRTRCLITKTRNLYQSVEKLTQLKTGRLKTIIKSTYHLKSKNAVLKAEEDFKIKAERIDLG